MADDQFGFMHLLTSAFDDNYGGAMNMLNSVQGSCEHYEGRDKGKRSMEMVEEYGDNGEVNEECGDNEEVNENCENDTNEHENSGDEDNVVDADQNANVVNEDELGDLWKLIVLQIDKPVHLWELGDLEKIVFICIEDADSFYKNYGRVLGFGVRREEIKWYKGSKDVMRRRWVCSREGANVPKVAPHERQRKAMRSVRCGCPASFRVNYCKMIGKFVVKEFNTVHNHPLVEEGEKHLVTSQKSMNNLTKEQTKQMKDVGIKTSQVMDYMVQVAGGYSKVGFCTKDLYNFVDSDRREQVMDSDAEAAIAYLTRGVEGDPGMYCKYRMDENNRLQYLMWSDSDMQMDYASFGDVLGFDATFRTNEYKMPFVIFVGVNNHHSTTVFACALVTDQTEDGFVWLLERFLECMSGKSPVSVITDQDAAMRGAIRKVFPDSVHRICSWHLMGNCAAKVKSGKLRHEFQHSFAVMMNGVDDEEEFERIWAANVAEYGLANNTWVKQTYEIRKMWAKCYLKNYFFAGMTSNQRTEGMHAYQKRFLTRKLKLLQLVRQVEIALRRLRAKVVEDNFKTKHKNVVLTTHLPDLETHASEVYTDALFRIVSDEIRNEAPYTAVTVPLRNPGECVETFLVGRYRTKAKKREVIVDGDGRYNCSCGLQNYKGIPCRHIFAVLKVQNADKIPETLIMRRWTIQASRRVVDNTIQWRSVEELHRARQMQLANMCNKIVVLGARCNTTGYEDLRRRLTKLCMLVGKQLDDDNVVLNSQSQKVLNPEIPKKRKQKGTTSRKCTLCGNIGHDRRNCPTKPTNEQTDQQHTSGAITELPPQIQSSIPSSMFWGSQGFQGSWPGASDVSLHSATRPSSHINGPTDEGSHYFGSWGN